MSGSGTCILFMIFNPSFLVIGKILYLFLEKAIHRTPCAFVVLFNGNMLFWKVMHICKLLIWYSPDTVCSEARG